MKIETVHITTLRPHPGNPRVHPESSLRALEKSISEYGWTSPILISKDNVILAGHARLKAARSLGLDKVPVVRLELEGARAEAYMVMDNRSGALSDWDMPRLKDLLQELDSGAFDMALTGFDDEAICSELGMEADELLRLKYITGFAKLFEDVKYRKAWETRRMVKIRRDYCEA